MCCILDHLHVYEQSQVTQVKYRQHNNYCQINELLKGCPNCDALM